MNNIFNLRRFLLLLRKTVLERPVQIFGLVLLNIIIVLALYSLLRKVIGWNGTQNLTFIWGFIFGGCYLSASMFNFFSNNANGSSYLTLPASHFEKWLVAILITWIFYVVVFLVFYGLMDSTFVSYYHAHLNPHDPDYRKLYEMVQPFDLGGTLAGKTYVMFANFSGAMFVGALFFNKISFIKTGLIICIVLVGVYSLNLLVANMFFPQVSDAFPFSHVAMDVARHTSEDATAMSLRPGFDEASVRLPPSLDNGYGVFIRYILPAILCITAYIRLREKEF